MIDGEYGSPLLLVKVKANLDYSMKNSFFDDRMPFRFFDLGQLLPNKAYIKKVYLDRLESCMYNDNP